MHILIIEDDLDLGFALQQALKAEGISSVWLRRVADAPRSAVDPEFDCILLDLALPDGNGFDLLKRWRSNGVVLPVIMITARSGLDDRLAGLDGGADDFIIKPFAMAELLSRLRAPLRRYASQASALWTLGALQINPRSYQVWLDGVELELLRREIQLLLELARDPGTVIQKAVLEELCYGWDGDIDSNATEVHIHHLRKKFGSNFVKTVRGVGYMLVSQHD